MKPTTKDYYEISGLLDDCRRLNFASYRRTAEDSTVGEASHTPRRCIICFDHSLIWKSQEEQAVGHLNGAE